MSPAGGGLTTHVLDTARGRPAAGLRVDLSIVETDGRTRLLRTATTNADGRCDAPLLAPDEMQVARYELVFHVGAYFRAAGVALPDPSLFEQVPVRFAIADRAGRYHVPLLVSPYGYVTYRGS